MAGACFTCILQVWQVLEQVLVLQVSWGNEWEV